MNHKWDWQSVADHKRAVKAEIEIDIQKLEQAIQLISEVNEPLVEAYWKKIGEIDSSQESTGVSTGSAPMKLQRCISEIKLIRGVLKTIKNRGF